MHIIGVVVMALFCSLIARLWFLQVNESATNISIANESYRTIRQATPRGVIYDSAGRVLVGNRPSWAVLADPGLRLTRGDEKTRRKLVEDARTKVVPKLAKLLGIPQPELVKRLNSEKLGPLESIVIAADLTPTVHTELVEHADQYPLVKVVPLAVRWYQFPDAAPQTLGFLGLVDSADIEKHPNYGRNDLIGRGGIEAAFESALRGEPSSYDVRVTPSGQPVGEPTNENAGRPGYDVRLTIDADLQRFAQQSLAEGIAMARSETDEDFLGGPYGLHNYKAPGGAVVIMDTTDGSIKALASNPGYENSTTVVSELSTLNSKESATPLLNRATRGLYAPGSTFKLISGIAMTRSGVRGVYEPYNESNRCFFAQGLPEKGKCSPAAAGVVDLREAITKSADVYFYTVGNALWDRWKAGDVRAGYELQNVAREFGFGEKTGIEIGESAGRVPDEAWKQAFAKTLYPKNTEADLAARNENDDWRRGDNISLAVGQGDVLVSPLQLAAAYGAFANGGKLWQPHLVASITDASGNTAPGSPKPNLRREIAIPEDVRMELMNGFGGVTSSVDGTAHLAFQNLNPVVGSVAGKTGTAQVGKAKVTGDDGCVVQTGPSTFNADECKGDTSWFVGMYAPPNTDQTHPRYIVLAMVEEGGRGGRVAAPIVRQIIEHMAKVTPTKIPQLTSGTKIKG